MRLRLFNIRDEGCKLPVIFDRFPVSVPNPARWGSRESGSGLHEACQLEDRDGTLHVVATTDSLQLLLNGQPFASTPVLPGDRLTLGSITFVISYDRTAVAGSQEFPQHNTLSGIDRLLPLPGQPPETLDGGGPREHVEDHDSCLTERCACCSPAELVHVSTP